MLNRYEIPEENYAKLTKKLRSIESKCLEMGIEFKFNRLHTKLLRIDNSNRFHRVHVIELEGIAQVNGWEFLARLEDMNGTNLITNTSDIDLEDYRARAIQCEHCNSNRARKHAYLVRNSETGDIKMIGKQCLSLYTGGLNPQVCAMFESVIHDCEEAQFYSGMYDRYFEVLHVLALTVKVVSQSGYVNSQSVGSTASVVMELIRKKDDKYSQQTAKQAEVILEWFRAHAESSMERFGYMNNLITLLKCDSVHVRYINLLCSAVPTYNRAMDFEERERLDRVNGENTRHVGECGQRMEIPVQSFGCITSWNTMYGTTYVYKIIDFSGNVFTWRTGKAVEGEVTKITGTVKRHTEFRGVKQTEITRCKVSK
jgi:hypothetical protein